MLFAVVVYTCNRTVISAVCRKHNEKLSNLSDDSERSGVERGNLLKEIKTE